VSTLSWILLPVILTVALALYLLALTAAGWAVLTFCREARFQAALRFRKVRVPADGNPLDDQETQAWEAIVDGRKQQAQEPVYQEWGEP